MHTYVASHLCLSDISIGLLCLRLSIFMHGNYAVGKVQRNNHHNGQCAPSFAGKMSLVYLMLHTHAQYMAELEVAFTSLLPLLQ